MRIAIVSLPSYYFYFQQDSEGSWGGAEVQQSLIAQELSRRGADIRWVVENGPNISGLTQKNNMLYIPIHYPPNKVMAMTPIYRLPYPLAQLYASLNYADADIYYQRIGEWTTGVLALYRKLRGKPFVFSVAHDDHLALESLDYSNMDKALIKQGIKSADAVVVQSKAQMKLLKKNFNREGRYIPSVVKIPKGAYIPPEDYVLWVGRFEVWKHPELFIEAARSLPNYRFVMIGGPSKASPKLFSELENAAKSVPNLEFLGHHSYKQTYNYIARAAVLVNTSSQEGFPNTFLQAWSHSRPVISVSIDPDNIITDNSLGIISGRDKLPQKIDELMSDRGKVKSLGKRGYNYVSKYHSVKVGADRYEELFSELTG